METLLEPLSYAFFQRALLAAALVGTVSAVVGTYVVLKGLAFMGDAISHAAFPGVVAAYLLQVPFYLGAAVAALGTALAIGYVSRHGRMRNDAAIGVVFAGMFALGIFLFSTIQGFVVDLVSFLFGNVLAIGPEDLMGLALLALIVLAVVAVLWKELLYATFDPLGAAAAGLPVARLEYVVLALIALTIVVSLQSVGIILVVAMLVTPAATAQLLTIRFGAMMALAVVIGVLAAVGGLYLSFWLDAASGATIVLVETGAFLLALLGGPRSAFRRRQGGRSARRGAAGPTSAELDRVDDADHECPDGSGALPHDLARRVALVEEQDCLARSRAYGVDGDEVPTRGGAVGVEQIAEEQPAAVEERNVDGGNDGSADPADLHRPPPGRRSRPRRGG